MILIYWWLFTSRRTIKGVEGGERKMHPTAGSAYHERCRGEFVSHTLIYII